MVPAYRLYFLDGAGRVDTAEWLEAADDSTAIEASLQLSKGIYAELWQGQRFVTRLDHTGSISDGAG